MSNNKVVLVGNLTRDAELMQTEGKTKICRFTVAVNREFSDGTDFPSVTTFSDLAESCASVLKKGDRVKVTGRISTRKYEKDGATVYATDIIGDDVGRMAKGNAATAKRVVSDIVVDAADAAGSTVDDLPY